MTDVLQDLYIACDPNKPATAEQYVDLSAVRGQNAFARQVERELRLATRPTGAPSAFVRSLFSGHSGCGKSSELRHLCNQLSSPQPERAARFLPVLMDGAEFLDDYDTDIEDILVAILVELAEQVRLHTNIDLRQTYLAKRWDQISSLLLSDVTVDEGEVSIFNNKAKIRLAQQSSEDRNRIRKALRPQLPTFLEQLNSAFSDIRDRLGRAAAQDGGAPYRDFVLIADSLDRILRAGGQAQGEPSQRLLFLEGGQQLVKLEAHAIWTLPLALVRAAAGELATVFGCAPYVLPMVKTESRGRAHEPYRPGCDCLIELLARRIAPSSLEDAMTEEARDWMLAQSGGDVRGLMKYARTACLFVEQAPITIDAARIAVNRTAATFAPAIRPTYWPKLAALELSPVQEINNNDSDCRDMLRQTWILEYVNGRADGDVTPWYAVHPVVRALPQFERALAVAQASSG